MQLARKRTHLYVNLTWSGDLWNQHLVAFHGRHMTARFALVLLVCFLQSPPKAIAISFSFHWCNMMIKGGEGSIATIESFFSSFSITPCTDRMIPPLKWFWSQESKPMPIRVGYLRAHLARATPTTLTTVTPTASDGDGDHRSACVCWIIRTWQQLKWQVHGRP